MNYTEAVSLARAGEERGFGFLYQNTYKSKYYLALQYMKNEEAAKDVLQEAYIKAFSKLDALGNPEAFPGWLGTIVANTAKNMLAKNNPMLFSDVAADDENENFEYQIEDENAENQPELFYTYTIDAAFAGEKKVLQHRNSKWSRVKEERYRFPVHADDVGGGQRLPEEERPVIIGAGPAGLFFGRKKWNIFLRKEFLIRSPMCSSARAAPVHFLTESSIPW